MEYGLDSPKLMYENIANIEKIANINNIDDNIFAEMCENSLKASNHIV